MNIKFIRVLSIRSGTPIVLARADGHRVQWTPRKGWSCTCDTEPAGCCDHLAAVSNLLDDAVFTNTERNRE